jgi:membrane fusion protein (multidrug efflux system)
MFRSAASPQAPSDESLRVERPRNRRWWLLAILCLVGILVALVGIKASQIGTMIKKGKAMVPPPEAVTSAKVESVEWPAVRAAVGSVLAVQGVTLGAELPGTVRQIAFESGAEVKKGQLLVKLDTSSEEAQLAGALADNQLAQVNLERARKLHEGGASSQAELDLAEAKAKQTQSAIASLRAMIAKKTIHAPFDGRAGIRQVELGQVISPGSPIVSLQSVNPMYVEFQVPQQALADLRPQQKVDITVDTFPRQRWTGEVTTISPEVDPQTRNVRVRATVPNPDGRLTPGMFANVEVRSGERNKVRVVPATSVIFAPYGDSVFVLEDGKDAAGKPATVVRQRFIRTGERRGDFVVVTSGLEPGEQVVSNGAFKLRNGMAVKVNNALAPPASVNPTPSEN